MSRLQHYIVFIDSRQKLIKSIWLLVPQTLQNLAALQLLFSTTGIGTELHSPLNPPQPVVLHEKARKSMPICVIVTHCYNCYICYMLLLRSQLCNKHRLCRQSLVTVQPIVWERLCRHCRLSSAKIVQWLTDLKNHFCGLCGIQLAPYPRVAHARPHTSAALHKRTQVCIALRCKRDVHMHNHMRYIIRNGIIGLHALRN